MPSLSGSSNESRIASKPPRVRRASAWLSSPAHSRERPPDPAPPSAASSSSRYSWPGSTSNTLMGRCSNGDRPRESVTPADAKKVTAEGNARPVAMSRRQIAPRPPRSLSSPGATSPAGRAATRRTPPEPDHMAGGRGRSGPPQERAEKAGHPRIVRSGEPEQGLLPRVGVGRGASQLHQDGDTLVRGPLRKREDGRLAD